jgi:hypothetical protein
MKGQCLCGVVRIAARDMSRMTACHCSMCQRWGGGPYMSVHLESKDVNIEGSDDIRTFRSSDWAERGFCGTCGTHLFYRLVQSGDYALPVGLFQDGTRFEFQEQIFVDEKSASYEFANDTSKLTGAEVFAKYLPPA